MLWPWNADSWVEGFISVMRTYSVRGGGACSSKKVWRITPRSLRLGCSLSGFSGSLGAGFDGGGDGCGASSAVTTGDGGEAGAGGHTARRRAPYSSASML